MTGVARGRAPTSGRLAALVAAAGLTNQHVAETVGQDAAQELLSDGRLPSRVEVVLLAALLRLHPAVLTGESPLTVGASLRLGALSGVDDVASIIERAEVLIAVDRLLAAWQLCQPSRDLQRYSPSLETYAKAAGRDSARRFRAYVGLDSREPIADLIELVESLGHSVEHRPMPAGVHGLSVPDRRPGGTRWTIFVNSNDSWGRQRYTLAHELCHVLYDDEGQVIVDRVEPGKVLVELRAEVFARHLLLPDQALGDLLRRCSIRSPHESAELIAEVIFRYGLSRDATVRALRDAQLDGKLIDRWADGSVAQLMMAAGRLAEWNAAVQQLQGPAPSRRLTAGALEAFSRGLVGIQTVAEVLTDGDTDAAAKQLVAAGWDKRLLVGTH